MRRLPCMRQRTRSTVDSTSGGAAGFPSQPKRSELVTRRILQVFGAGRRQGSESVRKIHALQEMSLWSQRCEMCPRDPVECGQQDVSHRRPFVVVQVLVRRGVNGGKDGVLNRS